MKRRLMITVLVVVGLVVGWHFFLTLGWDRSGGEVSVNPLTNVVRVTVKGTDPENMFAPLGDAMIQSVGPAFLERELNLRAREKFDLYAMIVPYRVRVATVAPEPSPIVRVERAADDPSVETFPVTGDRALDEDGQREMREYIAESLALERVRVAKGTKWGDEVDGVFGTVVNNGKDTLRAVTVRVYFLDQSGQRIGEEDFHPVWVTELSLSRATAPLRPGYRQDFGYSVEKYAPSGWAKRVEVEIVDAEILERGTRTGEAKKEVVDERVTSGEPTIKSPLDEPGPRAVVRSGSIGLNGRREKVLLLRNWTRPELGCSAEVEDGGKVWRVSVSGEYVLVQTDEGMRGYVPITQVEMPE